jgi:hypothetical protein
MAHCAKVARRKGNVVRKNQTRDEAGRGTSKRWTFGRRYQLKLELNYGIRNRYLDGGYKARGISPRSTGKPQDWRSQG